MYPVPHKSTLVRVGTIGKPHGIKGEVFCDFDIEDLSLLDSVRELFLSPRSVSAKGRVPGTTNAPVTLRSWREHKGRVLLSLQGVDDRDKAESLCGRECWMDEQLLPPLGDEEVFLFQLHGCRAFLDDGSSLGEIRDILTPTPEQEIWVIETQDHREVLFPAHPDTVLEIDLDAGIVRIAPPEGLLEIYLQE